MNKIRINIIIAFLGLLFISYGCQNEEAPVSKEKMTTPNKIKTLNIEPKEFQRIIGWIDDKNCSNTVEKRRESNL
ncbi:hypothetical protein [Listeria cornellensis]|uniref:Lipoprotein n=1 Tax=Listeria cornellensis FSL F6-0969 TaxID=1265820 RepID=W7C5A0_9LIST|nr:hypothetical protein [Listeria cornellensis]EUJ30846.1 hypothetical protein PCORN_07455 [Listeria cornellensis FSL F6-0969]